MFDMLLTLLLYITELLLYTQLHEADDQYVKSKMQLYLVCKMLYVIKCQWLLSCCSCNVAIRITHTSYEFVVSFSLRLWSLFRGL